MPEEQNPGEEPEINAVAVNLADLAVDDELDDLDDDLADDPGDDLESAADELEEASAKEEKKGGGGLDDIMDDIFADEQDDDDRLKAFGDLEHLTMIEVSSEVEAVLEELRLRQATND